MRECSLQTIDEFVCGRNIRERISVETIANNEWVSNKQIVIVDFADPSPFEICGTITRAKMSNGDTHNCCSSAPIATVCRCASASGDRSANRQSFRWIYGNMVCLLATVPLLGCLLPVPQRKLTFYRNGLSQTASQVAKLIVTIEAWNTQMIISYLFLSDRTIFNHRTMIFLQTIFFFFFLPSCPCLLFSSLDCWYVMCRGFGILYNVSRVHTSFRSPSSGCGSLLLSLLRSSMLFVRAAFFCDVAIVGRWRASANSAG